jgi:hypothetical protein
MNRFTTAFRAFVEVNKPRMIVRVIIRWEERYCWSWYAAVHGKRRNAKLTARFSALRLLLCGYRNAEVFWPAPSGSWWMSGRETQQFVVAVPEAPPNATLLQAAKPRGGCFNPQNLWVVS